MKESFFVEAVLTTHEFIILLTTLQSYCVLDKKVSSNELSTHYYVISMNVCMLFMDFDFHLRRICQALLAGSSSVNFLEQTVQITSSNQSRAQPIHNVLKHVSAY